MRIDRSFRRLSNTLPFMLAFVDSERKYRFVNKAYEDFFGVKLADLKGKSVAEVVGEKSYEAVYDMHSRVLAGEEIEFTDKISLKDGRIVQLNVKYVPNVNTSDKSISGFFAVINDVTEYASAAEVLRAVHDVVNRQSHTLSTDRIEKLLKLGCYYLNTQTGIVSKVDDDVYTVKHSFSEGDPIPNDTSFPLKDTYCSVTLEADNVVATESASEEPKYLGHPCIEKFQLETYVGLPIKVNGKTWGTLNFTSPEKRITPFSELDIELMGLICSAIETILINSSKTRRLERLAYTDFLTGLTNRLFITERLEAFQLRDSKSDNISCFAIVDIDHFKQVNDDYGHDVGDLVLQQTAQKLGGLVRISDCCSRVGGEEFALILSDIPSGKAESVLEKIRQAVSDNEIETESGQRISVTVSIGATRLLSDDQFSSAYKRADIGLYKSKAEGRNRVTWQM